MCKCSFIFYLCTPETNETLSFKVELRKGEGLEAIFELLKMKNLEDESRKI
jgi:hypothetical protein